MDVAVKYNILFKHVFNETRDVVCVVCSFLCEDIDINVHEFLFLVFVKFFIEKFREDFILHF
jgi:hypothetical protein